MRLLRTILIYLIFPWVSPFLFFHAKLKDGFWQRFGFGRPPNSTGRPHVWLHGASAGDILALVPTAKTIRELQPHASLTLTAMTGSGFSVAKRHAELFDHVQYFPWDLPGSIRRTLDKLKPDVIVFEYAELWPELMHQASLNSIPMILHNGRFSRERFEGYQKLFRLTGNLVQQLDKLLVRDESEKQRAVVLGANPDRVIPTGNTKFDQFTASSESSGTQDFFADIHFKNDGSPVLVAGSTHDGEEEILLACVLNLRKKFPSLRLILAPRYVERAAKIRELVVRSGLKVALRTKPDPNWDVLILDTVGELSIAYRLSTLVFVGGSINDRGGHNIIEPALCERPVIFGPYMSNVEDSVQVLLGRGGLQISTPEQLERIIDELLSSPVRAQELGIKAARQARSVQGASLKNAELILETATQRHPPT
jgi:3-deoxy-D-manno-octulosonic-acid transferase